MYCLHAQGRLQWTERRSESARENREMLDMQSSSDLSGQGSKKWQAPSLECNLRRSLQRQCSGAEQRIVETTHGSAQVEGRAQSSAKQGVSTLPIE